MAYPEDALTGDVAYYINHKGDLRAWENATTEERIEWNKYACDAADAFDADPTLDRYDSHHVYPGINRDGVYGMWVPSMWFPEWLLSYREKNKCVESQ